MLLAWASRQTSPACRLAALASFLSETTARPAALANNRALPPSPSLKRIIDNNANSRTFSNIVGSDLLEDRSENFRGHTLGGSECDVGQMHGHATPFLQNTGSVFSC